MTTTYASGETPQIGDTVRFIRDPWGESPVGRGGLDTVVELDTQGWVVCSRDVHKQYGWNPGRTFDLVSRAKPEAPAIDVSAIKPGDFVTVRLEVIEPADRDGELILQGSPLFGPRYLNITDVVGHEPKAPEPLKVGDRVRMGGMDAARVILAIDDGKAWTKRESDGNHAAILLKNLERVS